MRGRARSVQLWDNAVKALLIFRAVKGVTGRASVLASHLFSNIERGDLAHNSCSIPFPRAALEITGICLDEENVLYSSPP